MTTKARIYMDAHREAGSHADCPKGRTRGTFSVRHVCTCDAQACPGGADFERNGWAVCEKHAARIDAGAAPISWTDAQAATRATNPALADARESFHAAAR